MTNRHWALRVVLLSRSLGLLVTLLSVCLAGAGSVALAQSPTTPELRAPDSDSTLKLAGGRLEITVEWQTSTDGGWGHPVVLTESTGYFWFFDPTNVEVLVKVVDACADYGHEWLFAGGLTDLGVTMKVKNTHNGIYKTYTNPKGTPFLPIQDTNTFVTACAPDPPPPPPPPTPPPPPPPPPASGPLNGLWTGTFDSVVFLECDSNVPAQATFTQHGWMVDGVLSADPNGCGPDNAAFHGAFQGSHLEGQITGGNRRYRFHSGSRVLGTLSGTTLELTLENSGTNQIPGGVMHLHRH